jgi:pimeloyl-ACP methyl ester carboxylesterase
MSWVISDRSVPVTTPHGIIAVRIDGDPAGPPLLLCQRFRGTMDDWDPEFIALLAQGRRVIRFDSAGVGESGGITPNTVRGMAEIVPALLHLLKIEAVDLLGWSLGGYVAQTVALGWPTRGDGWLSPDPAPEDPMGHHPIRVSRRSQPSRHRRTKTSGSCFSPIVRMAMPPRAFTSAVSVEMRVRRSRWRQACGSGKPSLHGGREKAPQERNFPSSARRSWSPTA